FNSISSYCSLSTIHSILLLNPDNATIASLHTAAWDSLAYGHTLIGVIGSSISSFTAPLLEEIVFSGLLANSITKACGVRTAIVGVPACFAFAHVIHFGFGVQIILLYFAGLIYVLIRISSGSLLFSILSHQIINMVVLAPKWLIPYLHFRQG